MPDGVLQLCERAVVEEGWLERHVADRRRSKLVAITCIFSDLFQAEILVLSRSVESHITGERRDLRYGYDMLREVAEHLVGCARNLMTLDTSCLAKEQQRSSLLF